VIANLMTSAATFRRCTAEKLAFVILNLIDLGLTLLAVSQGAHELNPLMRNLVSSPFQLYMTKLALPLFFAWLVPGKLLWPSIALLTFIVGWDLRELAIFFF
jgi:hypothetical protein